MKTLTIILLAMLISLGGYAQLAATSKAQTTNPTPKPILTPGLCLQKASGNMLGGIFMTVAGSLIINHSYSAKIEEEDQKSLRVIGIISMATGSILQLRGIALIGKAGKLMEQERQKSLSYYISPGQAGIALNF